MTRLVGMLLDPMQVGPLEGNLLAGYRQETDAGRYGASAPAPVQIVVEESVYSDAGGMTCPAGASTVATKIP